MQPVKASPVKDGRRVLGDKTPNASRTPAKKRIVESEKSSSTPIPLKPFKESPKPRKVSPPPCLAGQKRTIDQLEENADRSDPRKAAMTCRDQREKRFQIFEDPAKQLGSSEMKDSAVEASEPQTLDKHASPQKYRIDSHGISRESSERVDTVTPSRVPTEPEARKRFIREKAALVRSRIQTAMRRVEDNSLDRALSEFEANSRSFSRHSFVSQRNPPPQAASDIDSTSRAMSASESRRLLPTVLLEPSPRSQRNPPRVSPPPSPSHTNSSHDSEDYMRTPRASEQASPTMRDEPSPRQQGYRNVVDRMIAENSMRGDTAVDGLMKLMETTKEYDGLDTWKG